MVTVEQGFDITAGLKIRKATMDDATALRAYCFPSDTLEETEKQLKRDIERMERGEMFRLVAEVNSYAVGNIQLEFNKGKRKKVAQIHKLHRPLSWLDCGRPIGGCHLRDGEAKRCRDNPTRGESRRREDNREV